MLFHPMYIEHMFFFLSKNVIVALCVDNIITIKTCIST